MPKGKKFDAAEKHFLKQKENLDRIIRGLRTEVQTQDKEIKRLARLLELERNENLHLQLKNQALQETAGLTDSEVRTLVKKAEALNAIGGVMAAVAPHL